MKKGKIILGAAALVAFIGSVSFAGNSKTRFGQGTLFTKPASGCHAVNCKRITGTTFCSDIVTYYTKSDCRDASKLDLGTKPVAVGA